MSDEASADGGDGNDEELLEEFPTRLRRQHVWWPAAIAGLLALCLGTTALVLGASGSAPGTAGAQAAGISTPTDSSADAGFARDMSVEHQQAVELASIVRDRTENTQVRLLAGDITSAASKQHGMLADWLRDWGLSQTSSSKPMAWMDAGMDMSSMSGMDMGSGYQPHDGSLMSGMATNTRIDELKKANGKAAEVLFLQLMIAHHKGSVAMAQGYLPLSREPTEKQLAQMIVAGQTSEIKLMTGMLTDRGAKPLS